jgi:hypothetical protein
VHATADVDHLTGEVGGLRRDEERDGRGHLVDAAEAPVSAACLHELPPRGREVAAAVEVRAFGPGDTTFAVIPRLPSWNASSEVHGSTVAFTAP